MKNPYVEIDERVEALQDLLKSSKGRAAEFQSKFDLSLIYHENALEGVVFTCAELLAALDPTAVPEEASQVPIFAEVRNHKAALELIREEAANKKSKLTVPFLKKLYEVLGEGLSGREKAVYRKEMPLHRTYFHDIAQPTKIPTLLEKVVELTSDAEFKELHAIEQAATLQWQFMQVFPFSENSGKIGRLLTQYILFRYGYLPAIIHASDRQRYYESLRLPVSGLRQLLVEAMDNSLENAFKFFEQGRRPVQYRVSNG